MLLQREEVQQMSANSSRAVRLPGPVKTYRGWTRCPQINMCGDKIVILVILLEI